MAHEHGEYEILYCAKESKQNLLRATATENKLNRVEIAQW
jgi:hypothetical protein